MRGRKMVSVLSTALAAVLATSTDASAGPEVFRIGKNTTDRLPHGREADGIIGDFVLRNGTIEALVSGNQHERKANMGVHWHAPTPGCLYDLALAGEEDQLTWFGPGRQEGPLSSVFILADGSDGHAIVRAELAPDDAAPIAKSHDYILGDGWRHLVVVSTYLNASDEPVKIKPAARWKGLTFEFGTDGITTGLCQDPDDRIGYAFGPIEWKDASPARGEVELAAHETRSFATAIAIGRGTLEAYGIIAGLSKPVHTFRGRIVDVKTQPARQATLMLAKGEHSLVGYVEDDGSFAFAHPAEKVQLTVKDLGRPDVHVDLVADKPQTIAVEPASGIHVEVTDTAGRPLPCKVQFIGTDGTETPYLGPIIRAHGCDNQYHSGTGTFTQHLPPGRYDVVITHGIEYDHVEKTVDVPEGTIVPITATLERIVDTTGWVSTDFHNHTTVSGDNYCGTDDRIINLAAENVEFAPATEHNIIYDWQPHIDKLKLNDHVATITGIEITGGGPHLNIFPLTPEPFTQDNGAPLWHPDPRINALQFRQLPGDKDSRWVQLNHPSVARYFAHLKPECKPTDGFPHFESFIDGAELWGEDILSGRPEYTREWEGKTHTRENWPFVWMQMINQGVYLPAVAVSDAHQVTQGGVGGWRMYVQSAEDAPPAIDGKEIIANAKAGRCVISSGPFLEVTANGDRHPGEMIETSDTVTLQVRVQCNTWVDIDRVAVLVNGRVNDKLDFRRSDHPDMFRSGTVRFEQELDVELDADAHLIVVAASEEMTLAKGYGRSWQKDLHPVAYNNPFFIDVDGNGFEPNGDTLDHAFLTEVSN